MNKKTLSILLAISLLVNVVFVVFSYAQKAAADEARLLSENERARAEANEMKARQALMEAERQAQRAVICMQELEEARK